MNEAVSVVGNDPCSFHVDIGVWYVFRPIIIPNPQQFPNPAAAHTVVIISDNGSVVDGSAMVIDVSGDADVSQKNVGLRPVHAVQQNAGTVLVVNQSVPGTVEDSLTKLNFSGTTIGTTNTITSAGRFRPQFCGYHRGQPGLRIDASVCQSDVGDCGSVSAVINTTQNGIAAIIPVGNGPDAMAETPNGQKLYVANAGDSTISALNTSDRSARGITGGSFNVPLWVSARSDSQRVYVLNGNGVVSTINTTTTAGPDR